MSSTIPSAIDFLVSVGLSDWGRVTTKSSLGVSHDFNKVALDPGSSYEQVYFTGLCFRQFNVLLNDQSYFQLTEARNSARLAYYPNPFTDPSGLLELVGDPSDMDAIELRELIATAGRAPLRYDYDPRQYVEIDHPAAHFHLGHGELGRLASARRFCALTFCMLVSKLYYFQEWMSFKKADADENGFFNELEARLAAAISGNGMISSSEFSGMEVRVVHVR